MMASFRSFIFALALNFSVYGLAAAQITGLIFPGPGGVVVTPATVTFVTHIDQTFSGTTNTFTSASIGTASAKRCVVIVVGTRVTASSSNVTGVTIGGSAATLVATAGPQSVSVVAIASLVVPTGTTATIVVTMNNSVGSGTGGIGIYNITTSTGSCPGTGAPASTNTSGATMNLNIPAGGVGIGSSSDNGAPNLTWTGLTRDFNSTPSQGYSGASGAFATAQTPLAIISTSTGGGNMSAVVAAFGP